ncbi:MAG: hypothetical protein ACFFDR_09795 [Candidatus Thorarchaeota archaeon]
MSTFRTNSIDTEDYQIDPNRRAQADCMKQTSYCLGSVALFILAGMLGTPEIAATLPGGPFTATLVSIGIVIAVLILCAVQMKR